jgi:hypothetical protein
MDVTARRTASVRAGNLMTRRPMTGEHTLKIEAARAGVSVEEYQARLEQGLLWCYRCQDWHQAEAFPADARRHTGRGGSCHQAIRAAARSALADRGQLPPPTAIWVIRRPGPDLRLLPWAYWCGPSRAAPGQDRAGTWAPALDDDTARFPGADQARHALIKAFGQASAVPPDCRLVRLA